MPSKLYGILAAGRPYLTNAPQDSELFDITVKNQIGITIPPGSPPAIAEAIRTASKDPQTLKKMGHHARQLAESQFTRRHAVQAFSQMLLRVV
jgi:glycosyltransferase involved in cell wall biosynthesis